MEQIYPGVYKVLPSKVTPSKYLSFFVKRPEGNILVPCFSSHSEIDAHFDDMDRLGGLKYQLLGDMHFRTKHCDEVAERFNAPLLCSEIEAPDVKTMIQRVETFPFARHTLEPGIEIIPTPGHRPGGVCYLVTQGGKKYCFTGDFIWHDGDDWKAFPNKEGRKTIAGTLHMVADIEFDVLLANSKVSNPVYAVEFKDASDRRAFIHSVIERLNLP